MLADEALYAGHPVAHVSAYYERIRLDRIAARTREVGRALERQRR